MSHLASPARLLVAAEWQRGVEDVVAVDPDGSGAQTVRDAMRATEIPGEDAGCKAIRGVVGASDKIVVRILERYRGHHGSKELHMRRLLCVTSAAMEPGGI